MGHSERVSRKLETARGIPSTMMYLKVDGFLVHSLSTEQRNLRADLMTPAVAGGMRTPTPIRAENLRRGSPALALRSVSSISRRT